MSRGRNRPTGPDDTHDRGPGQPARHPAGLTALTTVANLYMRRFVLGWKKRGLEQSLGTRLVTYADDLVILCRRGSAEKALQLLRRGWVRAIFGASVGIAIRGIRGISRK